MGSGMAKYSSNDTYYKRRGGGGDIDKCFSKEYSEYWKSEKTPCQKTKHASFRVERNQYSFSNSSVYDSPLRDRRRQSNFVSSFPPQERTFGTDFNSNVTKKWR